MSNSVLADRSLSPRQSDTVYRLVAAAHAELRAVGFDGLTVRNVARRAGVAPATAYTYFASREHLVTEAFWRRLRDWPPAEPTGATTSDRVAQAMASLAAFVNAEPALAEASTPAMLANDPDVQHLRGCIGGELRRRLLDALGPDPDPDVVRSLELGLTGAMLQAGMGHLPYADLASALERHARLVLSSPRRPS